MILSLQTTTFSAHGGIPTYNRLVCRVLNEMHEAGESHILIATDSPADVEKSSPELPNLRFQAFDGSRASLSMRFMQLALAHKVDLLLIGHINYAPLGWMLKRLQPQLRYGVMLYGIEAWQSLGRMRGHALRQANFTVSISEYTKQRAVEINALDEARMSLLPNALECSSIGSPFPEIPSSVAKGTRLLSVCRLEDTQQYKGVDKVLEVLPEVAKRTEDVQYTVVGGGTDLERHKKMAQELGVSERVHFLGFVDDETLQSCYRECHLFVMPSAGEGFGFVFLEAMKHGKAIVAANSGGAPEVIQDGLTGCLVEYGNKEELTQKLIDLCLDPAKRDRFGLAGYRRLQENFTFARFKEKLTEILLRELPSETLALGSSSRVRSSA
ncbi:MAG: glycosyltransferase family 4 protein [Pyrinomonadaceae bacterium]